MRETESGVEGEIVTIVRGESPLVAAAVHDGHELRPGINQIEIYFSILQRKALTPTDFSSQNAVASRILGFQDHYQAIAEPFEWEFTRDDLARLMTRSADPSSELLNVAA